MKAAVDAATTAAMAAAAGPATEPADTAAGRPARLGSPQDLTGAAPHGSLRRSIVAACGLATLMGSALALLAAQGLEASAPAFLGLALVAHGALAVLLALALPGAHPHAAFGAGNAVTLGRGTLVLGLGVVALAAPPAALAAPAAGWTLVVVATLAAVLDAVDGPLARRARQASAGGARFDMEIDALMVAILSLLVWRSDRAGLWVLASGAMRYVFVAATARWPWLGAPLPPSVRRKAVCVAQIVVLIVALGPIVPPWPAQGLCAAGLVALSASFAADLRTLARQRPRRPASRRPQELP